MAENSSQELADAIREANARYPKTKTDKERMTEAKKLAYAQMGETYVEPPSPEDLEERVAALEARKLQRANE